MFSKAKRVSLLAAFLTACLVFPAASSASATEHQAQPTVSDVDGEHLLEPQEIGVCGLSTFMQDSASATYHSLVSRIDGHGMAPTSLTGLYPSGLMYLRDASAQVLAMLAAGDAERAEPLMRYILQYPLAAGFKRGATNNTPGTLTLPHRVPALSHTLQYAQSQTAHTTSMSSADNILILPFPSSNAGAHGQITKLEIALSSATPGNATLDMRVISHDDSPMQIATARAELRDSPRWVTFELSPPGYGPGEAPDELVVVVSPQDTSEEAIANALAAWQSEATRPSAGALAWHGDHRGNPALRAFTADMRITDPLNGNDGYPLGDGRTWDEMDENLHVLYAWASYVEHTGDEHFFRDTWPSVQRYVDFYTSRSLYWLEGSLNSTSNLMMNPRLDAVEYHDQVYDLITNVFASATFDAFDRLANDPRFAPVMPSNISDSSVSWGSLADAIDNGIQDRLVVEVDGASVYIPWLKPDRQPDLGVGPIWVTLSPMAIEWDGFDPAVMRNTLDRYHEHNSFNFGGVRMLNARYAEDARPGVGTLKRYTGQWVLLKSLTWEVQFERAAGNTERLDELALWVGNYFPSTRMPAPESWIVDYPRETPVRDGGNQEHSSWYVHGLLQGFPECASEILHQSTNYTPPDRVGTFDPIDHERFAGSDRTHTSTLAANSVYQGMRPERVYLARGDDYADAISGGALADGPIILMPSGSSLTASVKATLTNLRPHGVVALGGPAVVSDTILNEAARIAGATSMRLSGNDRFATAAAIAVESFAQATRAGTAKSTVYLADGFGPDGRGSPDAVSAGSLTDGATLLVNPNASQLPAATRRALGQLSPTHVVALGGSAVVSDGLLAQARTAAKAATSSRLAGMDRYGTSVAIAGHAAKHHAREVILVRGDELADSVTAGGLNLGPILLTPSRALPPVVSGEIKRLRPWKVTVLGGSAVVHDRVVQTAALDAVRPG